MGRETSSAFRGFDPETAEAMAATWERRRPQIEQVAAEGRMWMVRELGLDEGDTVLELAAGTGDTGFDAAAVVGPEGRLICSDVSPAMLEAARRRGAERGVGNTEYRVIDAEQIELEDDSVDGVICRFGYMLMDDPAAALAETRRVLRPGGRLVLAVWGEPERNPFFGIIAMILIQRGHIPPPEPPPAPGMFSMASSERTESLLRAAGFHQIRTEELEVSFPLPNAEEYVSIIADTAGPLALVLQAIGEAEREAITAEAADSLGRFVVDGAYAVPGVVLCGVAS